MTETFRVDDIVTWQYLFGGERPISPLVVKMVLEIGILTGAYVFKVVEVLDLGEDEMGGVGHHQIVKLATMDGVGLGEPWQDGFSGLHFIKRN